MPAQGRARHFAGLLAGAHSSFARRRAPPEMDEVLHAERLDGRAKRLHRRRIDDLPDGAFIALEEGALRGARTFAAALDAARL